jgi:hypothetical protein
VCFLLVTGCSLSAQTDLPPAYYVGYSTDTRDLKDGRYHCPDGPVDLLALLLELRGAIDAKLSANHLGDVRTVIDLDVPDEIRAKVIDDRPHVRYLFSRRLSKDVVLQGEGGVILILRPCSKDVVDAVLFTFP